MCARARDADSGLVLDVFYHYGNFRLGEPGFVVADISEDLLFPANGLVSAWRGGALIATGAHTGVASVNFDIGRGGCQLDHDQAWDEVTEVTYESPVGQVTVVDP